MALFAFQLLNWGIHLSELYRGLEFETYYLSKTFLLGKLKIKCGYQGTNNNNIR